MKIRNWLKNTFKGGEPLRHYCRARWFNRVANVLQDIEGVGCIIRKPTDNEGRGWKIIVGEGDEINAKWAFEVVADTSTTEAAITAYSVLAGRVVWHGHGVYFSAQENGVAFTGGSESEPQYIYAEFQWSDGAITIGIAEEYPETDVAYYRHVLATGYKDADDNQIVTRINHRGDIHIATAFA